MCFLFCKLIASYSYSIHIVPVATACSCLHHYRQLSGPRKSFIRCLHLAPLCPNASAPPLLCFMRQETMKILLRSMHWKLLPPSQGLRRNLFFNFSPKHKALSIANFPIIPLPLVSFVLENSAALGRRFASSSRHEVNSAATIDLKSSMRCETMDCRSDRSQIFSPPSALFFLVMKPWYPIKI